MKRRPEYSGTDDIGSYDDIVALAKSLRRPIHTLLALSDEVDPFYAGRESRQLHAEWFAELWDRHEPTHLRALHYRLISRPTKWPDGSPYENTHADWKALGTASLDARYLGLVTGWCN
jgi:hypothetical protein